ncbi:MAG: hypothetical protein GEV09_00305 [Pseudonocardiaceae bacterium]|nr:hypothetical protein [Pseudonocardiaceae bacterium]
MAHRQIGVGERSPDFELVGQSGSPTRFYAYAGGRPMALVFGPEGAEGADARMGELDALLAGREDVATTRVVERSVAEAYGLDPEQPTVVVLDPNLRVTGVVPGGHPAAEVVTLLDAAAHRGPTRQVRDQAPVLFVPGVLDTDQCERLIRVSEQQGDVETGVERGSGGSRSEELDTGYKRRRDHTVGDPELLRDLSSGVGRRLMPEVLKAFAFRATRFEGFKIARYDASTGGFFAAHRDNLARSTAHRVFALTLNLNDAYEGGQLRFPEYGNQLYRPDAGAALVFSCTHLHEVREVTAGERFVLLSFLYGEPAPR